MTTDTQNSYIPGVCNIGPAEIQRRKYVGWTGFIVTIAMVALYLSVDVPAIWWLTLFLPATMSANGFLQAYMHFCAHFGFSSLFNFGDIGKTDTVQQAEFRAKDKRKALQITTYSVLIGLFIALTSYGLFR